MRLPTWNELITEAGERGRPISAEFRNGKCKVRVGSEGYRCFEKTIPANHPWSSFVKTVRQGIKELDDCQKVNP